MSELSKRSTVYLEAEIYQTLKVKAAVLLLNKPATFYFIGSLARQGIPVYLIDYRSAR